jgi:hypothetical protein
VAVQWLNQALCFYQSLCLVDSEVLRNRHLRVAAKRYSISGPFSAPDEFPDGSVNIAVINNYNPPLNISINNINNGNSNMGPCTNCHLYINNGTGSSPNVNQYIQYDGFTVPINIGHVVQPFQKYHIKIGVCDMVDRTYDTGLYIEAGSFITSVKEIAESAPAVSMEGSTLKIVSPAEYVNCTVRICTMMGKVVAQRIMSGNEMIMSLEDYHAGVYIVSCIKDDKVFNTKIVR